MVGGAAAAMLLQRMQERTWLIRAVVAGLCNVTCGACRQYTVKQGSDSGAVDRDAAQTAAAQRLRPPCLAVYSALSARESHCSMDSPARSAATPTLTVTRIGSPL